MIEPNTPFGTEPDNSEAKKWEVVENTPFAGTEEPEQTKTSETENDPNNSEDGPAYPYGALIKNEEGKVLGKVVSAPFENEQDAKEALQADSNKVNGYSAANRVVMAPDDSYYYIIEPE